METASVTHRLINCAVDDNECEHLQFPYEINRNKEQRFHIRNSGSRLPKLLSRTKGKTLSERSTNSTAKIVSSSSEKTQPLSAQFSLKKAVVSNHMNGATVGGLNSKITTSIKHCNSKSSPLTVNTINSNSNSGSNNNNVGSSGVVGGGVVGTNTGNQRMPSSRRPQIQISPIAESPKIFQLLTLTIHKDENGYGMKVSGDNPVFVESVKPGGAAQVAGIIAGDMILKVNGHEVRSETHLEVVSLIKSHVIVELSVKRSQKMQRPNSVGIGPPTPVLSGRDRTASITGPQPVDNAKKREMESYKIQTLQMMLEQEKLNMERLKSDPNNPSYKTSEANIRKLKEQLRQIGAEDSPIKYQMPPSSSLSKTPVLLPAQFIQQQHNHTPNMNTTPQSQQSSPAFLSLLPRSLSSLSLGTRKKADKDIINLPLSNSTDFMTSTTTQSGSPSSSNSMSQSLHAQKSSQQQAFYHHHLHHNHHQQQQQQQKQQQQKHNDKHKSSVSKSNKFSGSQKNLKEDTPPPLPQRNTPRNLFVETPKSCCTSSSSASNTNSTDWRRNVPVSDLDHSVASCMVGSQSTTSVPPPISPTPLNVTKMASTTMKILSGNITSANSKKRPKTKTKALSDPKMSTQIFLQMEKTQGITNGEDDNSCIPPPLPPRQPGMMEESRVQLSNSKKLSSASGSFNNLSGGNGSSRPAPNSIETIMNYPLVSTCTAVRDNISAAFPLSQRPNIVQQLQQHQQQQQQQQQPMNLHHSHQSGTGNGNCLLSPLLSAQHCQLNTTNLGLAPQNFSSSNKHGRIVSSPDNTHARDECQTKTSGSWEILEKDSEPTPPGTPPPPYPSTHTISQTMHGSFSEDPTSDHNLSDSHQFTPLDFGGGILSQHSDKNLQIQKEIISMEDEDVSDQESIVDENGPFNYLQRLFEPENVAHLAVFLNYVLSNSDPAPLLFYLITGLYKEGTVKDMRKWAYEIHSTFLVPCAPLVWFRSDESLAREVDSVLQNEFDKIEILRNVFLKSRKKAKGAICEQLRQFQQKRTAGLGTIYGPTDAQLADAKGDKSKEQRIFEETLTPKLQFWLDEHDKDTPVEDPKKLALCSALSTVLHRIFITRSNPNSIIDRVHHFVSREKSFKSRIMGKNRKMTVRGHSLVLRQYYEVTHCNHCQNIIWGVSPQGYHCTDCKLNIHRPCSKVLDESCPGPVPQKRKDQHADNKITKFMEKIRPTTHFMQMERRARQDEEGASEDCFSSERLHLTSIVRQPSDRRPDVTNLSIRSNGNSSQTTEHQILQSLDIQNNPEIKSLESDKNVKSQLHQQIVPVSVNRSESYKDRLSQKRNRNNRRKTSDPSLSSRSNNDQTDLGMSNSNYTASSNSSLSSGGASESPSISMEQVVGSSIASQIVVHQNTTTISAHNTMIGSGGSVVNNSCNIWSGNITLPAAALPRQWPFESEDDDDLTHEPDWSSNVAAEMLAALTDAEKKRQEIINEIYQTERSHVRTLKLLERIFMSPLQESGVLSHDHLLLLFPPALLSLKDLHSSFEQKLKMRRLDHNHIVSHVGDLLAGMFDGQSGDELREYAAQFCARQQIALEALKEQRRKDEQLQKILTKAESHKSCRRLQLKDLLPTVLQRLTKYPLLFENLFKITIRVIPDNQDEAERIQRALDSSKKILVDVNQAVKSAEDAYKLQTIQRKLDKSTFDKDEFKNLDLTQFKLIHDGSLTMKKNPGIQLHGLLFENMIVLLTRQDDKYSLKSLAATRSSEVNKFISPITYIDHETLVRQEAADKNSFFLIMTKTSQMLELRAPSSSECKMWFKHISDAAEQYKPRSKNNHETADDSVITTLSHSTSKESSDITRHPSTTATMTSTATSLNTNLQSTNKNVRTVYPISAQEDLIATNQNYSQNMNNTSAVSNVNRNMSTRSCEKNCSTNDVNNDNADDANETISGGGGGTPVNLFPIHSACKVSNDSVANDNCCIIYSNNSNNTRTLMQNSILVEPSAIQISINSAHVAEPVLTPSERLKRLDISIRDGLVEKQRIICDMFRLPIEHFNEIVDIVGQPEAPKDSVDIALAAYAQVQTLTELLNEYLRVSSPIQEISALSTSFCEHCHYQSRNSANVAPPLSPSKMFSTTIGAAMPESHTNKTFGCDEYVSAENAEFVENNKKLSLNRSPTPPLMPPSSNSEKKNQEKAKQFPARVPLQDDHVIHEDDDGYCEIDELRLPSLSMSPKKATIRVTLPSTSQCTPLPSPQTEVFATTSEPLKRHSLVSADSIPEESEQDIIQLHVASSKMHKEKVEQLQLSTAMKSSIQPQTTCFQIQDYSNSTKTNESLQSKHIEDNDAYDASDVTQNNLNAIVLMSNKKEESQSSGVVTCGLNRLLHATSLEPSVPCNSINSIVATLNSHISLLLPKINERDLERERLRKENQHLRELLNAMHERQRVESQSETPTNIAKSADPNQEDSS